MNANFRRDYLYKLDDKTLVRYLKYDRRTKEYIFLEGSTRHFGEFQLRVKDTMSYKTLSRVKKYRYLGYAATNSYLGSTRKDRKRSL